MPNQTPLAAGDVSFPQYSATVTRTIKANLAIVKGSIYTPDGSGRLIVPISTSSVADLSNGAYQAKEGVTAGSVEDTDKVQCLGAESRIIMKAKDGLSPGAKVELSSSSSTTDNTKVMPAVFPKTKGYIGTIFAIYTPNTDGTEKQVTADNDLVIIDFGES
jgi:hypothetical protein